MANRNPERRHSVRGPSGRWERPQAPAPGQAAFVPEPPPELPDEAEVAPARDARDARGAAPAPFRLNITAEDVTPAAPGTIPAPPPPGSLDLDPAIDVPAARMIAQAINTAIDMAGLPAASSPEVEKVGTYAAPVMRRAATRFGLGDAVGSTVPEWAVEIGNLAIAVGVAWGPAGVVVVRTAIARRTADEEGNTDAQPAEARSRNERARAPGGDDTATARGAAGWGVGPGAGGAPGGAGPRQPGPLDADGLASIFAAPGIRGPREG